MGLEGARCGPLHWPGSGPPGCGRVAEFQRVRTHTRGRRGCLMLLHCLRPLRARLPRWWGWRSRTGCPRCSRHGPRATACTIRQQREPGGRLRHRHEVRSELMHAACGTRAATSGGCLAPRSPCVACRKPAAVCMPSSTVCCAMALHNGDVKGRLAAAGPRGCGGWSRCGGFQAVKSCSVLLVGWRPGRSAGVGGCAASGSVAEVRPSEVAGWHTDDDAQMCGASR